MLDLERLFYKMKFNMKIKENKKMRSVFKYSLGLIFIVLLSLFTGCYSIFSGGASGVVVDSESTTTPKAGIANVDVYAYTIEQDRDTDFDAWQEGTVFAPKAAYYGHTTTQADGTFLISKLVWKTYTPTFGKDADYSKVFFIFYHENYGLEKGSSIIVSDSTSDVVYQELTTNKKTSSIGITINDVSTGNAATLPVYVSIEVPQTTSNNATVKSKIYEAVITGTGSIPVTYPRWQSAENRTNGVETNPTVTIKYYRTAQEVDWQACYNQDNTEKNYAFRTDAKTGIKKTITNNVTDFTFYGKPTKLHMPVFSGQYKAGTTATDTDDGVIIGMKSKGSGTDFSIDCGEVTTSSQIMGTTQYEKHGMYSGLGAGITWNDFSYTGKYATTSVRFYINRAATEIREMEIRGDIGSYTVNL